MGKQFEMPKFVSFTKTYHNKPSAYISPDRPELSVNSKNVVVAGGGTGIGKAIAIAFAQAGAASVSILGRRVNRLEETAKEIREAGKNAQVLTQGADFAQRAEAEAGLKAISDEVGKIDVFVWASGISPTITAIAGYDSNEFERGLSVNLVGAFNAVQAVLPVVAPDLKLFNISSGVAHMKPIKGLFVYGVTKAAAAKLFDSVATEHPDFRVVNIQPGAVATEMSEGAGVPAEGSTDKREC